MHPFRKKYIYDLFCITSQVITSKGFIFKSSIDLSFHLSLNLSNLLVYDIRLCAPQVLPCSHSFCLMCLNREDQKKKKKCPTCKKKYSSFMFNAVFAGSTFKFKSIILTHTSLSDHIKGYDDEWVEILIEASIFHNM